MAERSLHTCPSGVTSLLHRFLNLHFSEDETGPLTWSLSFVFVHTPWIDRRYINLTEKQEATGHWIRQKPYVTHLNYCDVAFKQINGSDHLPSFKVTSEVTLAHSW